MPRVDKSNFGESGQESARSAPSAVAPPREQARRCLASGDAFRATPRANSRGLHWDFETCREKRVSAPLYFLTFSRLAQQKKGPFFKSPPLVLPQQGRRGTENAFLRHVASRKRARDAAPRLPVCLILPSIPFYDAPRFFIRRRRREENCFVESVLKAREKRGGGKNTAPRRYERNG